MLRCCMHKASQYTRKEWLTVDFIQKYSDQLHFLVANTSLTKEQTYKIFILRVCSFRI